MALSQEFGPDLCENRSAPGTPPHGGAGDATRERRRVPGQRPAPAPHGSVTCQQRTLRSCPVRHGTARRSALSRVRRPSHAASAPLTVPSGRALRGSVRSEHGVAPPAAPSPDSLHEYAHLATAPGGKDCVYPCPAACTGMVLLHDSEKKRYLYSSGEKRASAGRGARSRQGMQHAHQQQAVPISHCCAPAVPGQCLDHPVHLGLLLDTCLHVSKSSEPAGLIWPRTTQLMPTFLRNTALQIPAFLQLFFFCSIDIG